MNFDLYVITGAIICVLVACGVAWRIAGFFREDIDHDQAAFRIPEDCDDQPK